MIKIEDIEVFGFDAAIRGMRNPMNSWHRSDGHYGCNEANACATCDTLKNGYGCGSEWQNYILGDNDRALGLNLTQAGTEHAKYRRMIVVYMDITAPLYWWKEFDTYKVGTVANSCSTMHKIASKEFGFEDFSTEHLNDSSRYLMQKIIDMLNLYRDRFNSEGNKGDWWQMIQLLPTSYNQKRTIMLNYEVLAAIYRQRKGHKLDEWHVFRSMIEKLPNSELITGGTEC